jgi:sulfur-oxidizing protein SoxZ
MPDVQPRVQAPGSVSKGEIFEVKTLISHPMETGLRLDEERHVIPRDLINKFSCLYNGVVVFSADLHEGMAANPFLSFYVRAAESGRLKFVWEEDGGAVFTLEAPLMVG